MLNLGADVGVLAQFLCIGDRVALRDFVRKSDSKSDTTRMQKRNKCFQAIRKKMRLSGFGSDKEVSEEEGREETEDVDLDAKPRVLLLKGNKNALKKTKAIEFGWYHNRYGRNVRKPNGGGTRQITVLKTATRGDLLGEGKKLFFPAGICRRSVEAEHCEFGLRDLTHMEFGSDKTVGELYDELKLSGKLRFFLYTTGPSMRKDSTEVPCTNVSSSDLPKTSTPVACSTQNQMEKPVPFDGSCIQSEDMADEQNSEVQFGPGPFVADMSDTVLWEQLQAAQPIPQATSPAGTQLTLQGTTHLYVVVDSVVQMSMEALDVKYQKDVVSKYGGGISTRSCFGRKQYLPDSFEPTEENSDPLDLGYYVGSVGKGGRCFLLHADSETQFPSHPTGADEVILHHPDEIWGYDDDVLVLGVISSLHNNDSLSYRWFREAEPLDATYCILEVSRAGVYYCRLAIQVTNGETVSTMHIESNHVHVVRLDTELGTLNVPVESTEKCSTAHDAALTSSTPRSPVINFSDITVYYEERIAQGAFGEVFKGQYAGKPAAVKRIHAKKGKRPEKQIIKEAQVHCQISHHANIVHFFGTCFRENDVFIVTEMVSGGSMEDLIYTGQFQDGTSLDDNRKMKLAVGALTGLAYLHENTPEILHMDIKPANILVEQPSVTAKLCDLGLAKIRSHNVASTTNAMQVAGTIEYMAPERLLLQEKATAACDVWSIGITLIELLSGEDPWNLAEQDDEPLLYIKAHMMQQNVLPICAKFEFPLLMSCVDYDQHQRPSARVTLQRFQCPSCSKFTVRNRPQ